MCNTDSKSDFFFHVNPDIGRLSFTAFHQLQFSGTRIEQNLNTESVSQNLTVKEKQRLDIEHIMNQRFLQRIGVSGVHFALLSTSAGSNCLFCKSWTLYRWLIVECAVNLPLWLEGLAADVQIIRETGLWGDSVHGVVRKSRAPRRATVTHVVVSAFGVLWVFVF